MKNNNDNIDVKTIVPGVTGATCSVGGDAYPYTIQSFSVSKTGRITIRVTADDFKWIAEANSTPQHPRGHYEYQTTPGQGGEVKLWTKQGQRWTVGERAYRQDPHF